MRPRGVEITRVDHCFRSQSVTRTDCPCIGKLLFSHRAEIPQLSVSLTPSDGADAMKLMMSRKTIMFLANLKTALPPSRHACLEKLVDVKVPIVANRLTFRVE